MTQKRSEQEKSYPGGEVILRQFNIVFSHDVTAAIFLFQKRETAAKLVFQTNPVGANSFFI